MYRFLFGNIYFQLRPPVMGSEMALGDNIHDGYYLWRSDSLLPEISNESGMMRPLG